MNNYTNDNWLKNHNRVRGELSINPVIWNDDIARKAEIYADKCVFEHSPIEDRTYNDEILGENLSFGDPYDYYDDDKMFGLWEDEKQHYVHPSYPNEIQGHYTQIINKKVKEIGCGCSKCKTSKICVCRYNPIQYNNDYPY